MLKVTLERAEPPCHVTFEADNFCVSAPNPAVQELLGEAIGLSLSREASGRVLVEVADYWTITVDEVQS